jgi:hypothetical protein
LSIVSREKFKWTKKPSLSGDKHGQTFMCFLVAHRTTEKAFINSERAFNDSSRNNLTANNSQTAPGLHANISPAVFFHKRKAREKIQHRKCKANKFKIYDNFSELFSSRFS